MNIEFRKSNKYDGKDIATWRYEGIYSFYDNDKTKEKQQWALNIHNEKDTFVMYNEENKLIGNCCFYFDDDNVKFNFGVQMRPDLTGKGMGDEVLKFILKFAKENYKFNEIYLLVAKFNKRAIKLYSNLGFEILEEFIWNVNGEETEFIEMKRFL